LILLISLLFHKKDIADRAKPQVIVGRLPRRDSSRGTHCAVTGAGGESHACVPERDTVCRYALHVEQLAGHTQALRRAGMGLEASGPVV